MAQKPTPLTALATTFTNAAKHLVGIPVTIEDLARRVADIEEEGSKLCSRADDLEDQLETMTDEDEIIRAMAGAKAARNRADVLARDLEVARDRLANARDAERVHRRDQAVANYREMMLDWLTKAREVELLARPIIEARDAFNDDGFNLEYIAAPRVPAFGGALHFDDGILGRVRAEVEQFGAPEFTISPDVPGRDRAVAAADREIFERVQAENGAKQHKLKAVREPVEEAKTGRRGPVSLRSLPPTPQQTRPLLRETAGKGQRLVVILRSGVDMPGKGQLRNGDVVAVAQEHAENLIRNLAADWADDAQSERSDQAGGTA